MADRARLILDASSPKEHPAQEARSRTRDHSIAKAITVKQIPSRGVRNIVKRCDWCNRIIESTVRNFRVENSSVLDGPARKERWGRTLPCRAGARQTSPTRVDHCARAGASAKVCHDLGRRRCVAKSLRLSTQVVPVPQTEVR